MIKRLAVLAISLSVGCVDVARRQARRLLKRRVPCTGVILYYHAVKAQQRHRFARQMGMLLRSARPFQAGSLAGVETGGRHAAVTFDDGFRSVVDNALPELVMRGIPFTIFVPSGSLGQRPAWVRDAAHPAWEERVLSAEELRVLANLPGVTIGSHSVTHRNLLELGVDQAERELVDSKADLEAAVGLPIDLFSFPHGRHSPALAEQARRAGYKRVYTIEPALVVAAPDAFAVGRVAVDPDDWPLEFRLKLVGAYRWRHHLQRLRLVG